MSSALINEAIRSDTVRLIMPDGEQIGVVPTATALKKADDLGLDLVVITEGSTPPVAKILDYRKYKFELEQKKRETRRNQHNADVKEVRFKLKIDSNDFNIKVAQAVKFLKGGDKLKIQIQFRGRENQHPELGVEMMGKILEQVQEFGTVVTPPTHEGRNVSMLMQPIAKKEKTISEQRRRGAEAKDARAQRQAKRLAAKGLDVHGNKIEEKGNKDAKK